MAPNHVADASGWRVFAGTMILLAGIFNFIDGIVAILQPHYLYVTTTSNGHALVFGDLRSWGWAILIVGAIEFLTAFAIYAAQPWAAVVGIVLAVLSAIGQLLFLGTYPWWSIIVIVLDVLVIYALAMHGFGARTETD